MRAAARRRVIRHPPSGQVSAQAVAALDFAARAAALPALRHRPWQSVACRPTPPKGLSRLVVFPL